MLSWLPKNVSTFGGDVDSIFYLIYYIMAVWFVLTYGAIIYCLIRYRRRPGQRAVYVHGNTARHTAGSSGLVWWCSSWMWASTSVVNACGRRSKAIYPIRRCRSR